jgi:hypothetical protein
MSVDGGKMYQKNPIHVTIDDIEEAASIAMN